MSIENSVVERYPEHGFVIDREEATSFGLKTIAPNPDQERILSVIASEIDDLSVIGRLKERIP